MDLVEGFLTTVKLVKRSRDPASAWFKLLELTNQSDPALLHMNILGDVRSVADQLVLIRTKEPFPEDLSFVYCGIFDALDARNRPTPGFYFAGGRGDHPETQLSAAKLSYFPEARFLKTDLLPAIKKAAAQDRNRSEILEYLVMFGAAAIIAKFAVKRCEILLPVFVGFDAGDFALVS